MPLQHPRSAVEPLTDADASLHHHVCVEAAAEKLAEKGSSAGEVTD
ncbi:hypothetical protein [Mycolicibacterium sp.]